MPKALGEVTNAQLLAIQASRVAEVQNRTHIRTMPSSQVLHSISLISGVLPQAKYDKYVRAGISGAVAVKEATTEVRRLRSERL